MADINWLSFAVTKRLDQCRFVMPSPRQSCWPLPLPLAPFFPEKWCDSELGLPQGNGASEGLGYRARDNPETKPQEALWIMHKQHGASGFLAGIGPSCETRTHLIREGQKVKRSKHSVRKSLQQEHLRWTDIVRNHFLACILVLHTLTCQTDASTVSDTATLPQFNHGICNKTVVIQMVINT